jgi:uncharacterized protein (UPF0212 family)
MPLNVLVAIINCPNCLEEFEGAWLAAEDAGEAVPEDTLQLCPSCGHTWEAEYPCYSFKTEAG